MLMPIQNGVRMRVLSVIDAVCVHVRVDMRVCMFVGMHDVAMAMLMRMRVDMFMGML